MSLAFALALTLALAAGALGLGVGWWLGRRERVDPDSEDPAPSTGPVIEGIAPERLWAVFGGAWVPLERVGNRWIPRTAPPADVREVAPFPPLRDWVRNAAARPEVTEALAGWTEACVGCSRVAWVVGIPAGDHLFEAWLTVGRPTDAPEEGFARWLVTEIGLAGRRGLVGRVVAEQRGPSGRSLHRAAARLVQALDPSLALDFDPPAGVTPRDAERWLIDDGVARVLGNATVAGALQPVVVLRPVLRRSGEVLVEGEVA